MLETAWIVFSRVVIVKRCEVNLDRSRATCREAQGTCSMSRKKQQEQYQQVKEEVGKRKLLN